MALTKIEVSSIAAGTDGELITWDAAGNPAAVAVGTATHVLTSNGTGAAPTFQEAAGGGLTSVQVFTSSGTWTKPAGITKVKVTVVGGGGGGGGAANNQDKGATGGAGGGTAIEFIDVSGTASETITIGAGGSGGSAGDSNGSAGGTSSFGSFCSATGGTGGRYPQSSPVGGTFVNGGVGSGGDINLRGQGGDGWTQGVRAGGGAGGNSFLGGGGASGTGDGGAGQVGYNGGGGSGAFSANGTSNYGGGAGGAGTIIVEEYA